ncbi:Hsp20/alpha crystallin family protein [Desulfurococcaceae archaeon MEX13E-LK6-19]|nr:Hsp20/alpha crystallin family protein [Desulfurococcaceae archaeon MEX13E-LK6-19]
MSWRRRRKSIFDLFDEFFRDIEEEFYRLMRDFEWFGREFMEKGGEGEVKVYGPYVYGFRITIGPDGKPRIEEFGNVKRVHGRPVISEEREPLVDVFEEDKDIVVIAEIPGVEKDKIQVKVSDDRRKLIIRASNEKRKYYKEVELPAPVDPSSAKASYKNGVLEVRLKKIEPIEKGYDIKVE